MKIVVFGASGAAGAEVLRAAQAGSHTVTAFVRNPASLTAFSGVSIARGDARDASAVAAAVDGQEAVISVLGSRSLNKSDLLERSSANIIAAMERHCVRRLIVLSAAGALHDATKHLDAIGRTFLRILLATLLRNVSRDQAAQEAQIERSALDYIIVRPPFLTNGPPTGRYRVDLEGLPAKWRPVSRADVAAFMVEQLNDASFVRRGPYIAK